MAVRQIGWWVYGAYAPEGVIDYVESQILKTYLTLEIVLICVIALGFVPGIIIALFAISSLLLAFEGCCKGIKEYKKALPRAAPAIDLPEYSALRPQRYNAVGKEDREEAYGFTAFKKGVQKGIQQCVSRTVTSRATLMK